MTRKKKYTGKTARRRKKKRVRWGRVAVLAIVFLLVVKLLGMLMDSFFAMFRESHPIEEDTVEVVENPVRLNSYQQGALQHNDGLYTYDDENYTSSIGIDVSYSQGEIDWNKVKAAGIDFAVIRAGYRGYSNGELHEDNWFRTNIQGAYNAGIKTEVYFFSQAIDEAEAIEEAEFVIDLVKSYSVDMIAFDMEPANNGDDRIKNLSQDELTGCAIAFVETIKKAGYIPMVYGSTSWFTNVLKLSDLQDHADIWIAHYNVPYPDYPYEYSMWQYSSSQAIDGINGPVDMNIKLIPR